MQPRSIACDAEVDKAPGLLGFVTQQRLGHSNTCVAALSPMLSVLIVQVVTTSHCALQNSKSEA